MENGLYRIAKDDLRRLDAGEAVALLSDLRWAEATQPGIPIRKVRISAELNMPDDGVDAKVSEHTAAGDFIRSGHTAYQIKSGESFPPQQEAVIRSELLGDNTPSH